MILICKQFCYQNIVLEIVEMGTKQWFHDNQTHPLQYLAFLSIKMLIDLSDFIKRGRERWDHTQQRTLSQIRTMSSLHTWLLNNVWHVRPLHHWCSPLFINGGVDIMAILYLSKWSTVAPVEPHQGNSSAIFCYLTLTHHFAWKYMPKHRPNIYL